MTDISSKVSKFLKIGEEKVHSDVAEGTKKKSLVEVGVKGSVVDKLLKMKRGVLTNVKFALDDVDASDCVFTFRILTAQEEADIFDEMVKLKYVPGVDRQYDIYYISKVLSRANTPMPSNMDRDSNKPELTEEILRSVLDPFLLLALGQRYIEFREKHSPRLETLTQEQIDEVVKDIVDCEGVEKKLITLSGLSLKQTQEVTLSLLEKLETITEQLEALRTGT